METIMKQNVVLFSTIVFAVDVFWVALVDVMTSKTVKTKLKFSYGVSSKARWKRLEMRAIIQELTIFVTGAWLDCCLFVLKLRVFKSVASELTLMTIFPVVGSVFISARKIWFLMCFEVVLRNMIYRAQIITCFREVEKPLKIVFGETIIDSFSPKQICSTWAVQGWEALRVQHSG